MASPKRIECLKRGLRNLCPCCGKGRILISIFIRHEHCPHCGLRYEREQGFFSAAMAINYALVCGLYLFPLLLIWWLTGMPVWAALTLSALGVILLPILCYRYSQCLWLGLYYFLISEDLERMDLEGRG